MVGEPAVEYKLDTLTSNLEKFNVVKIIYLDGL